MSPTLQTRMDAFSAGSAFLLVNKRLLAYFGAERTIFLSNLIDKMRYFIDRGWDNNGWFYLTRTQQQAQTGLSRRKVQKHKKYFQEVGVLKTKRVGTPSKEYFKVKLDKIEKVLEILEDQNLSNQLLDTELSQNQDGQGEKKQAAQVMENKPSQISAEQGAVQLADTRVVQLADTQVVQQKENRRKENRGKDNKECNHRLHKRALAHACACAGTHSHTGTGKRGRKVNRKKNCSNGSIKEKVQQKVAQNGKKKKTNGTNNNKVPYENKPNLDLIDLWNRQEHLRKHKSRTSKVYRNSLRKLEALRQGTLYKLISKSVTQDLPNDIPYEWIKKKWSKIDIAKAIRNLNEWCKEGNYPKNKDWLKRLSLEDAIFNPNTGNSVLMSAYRQGVTPLYQPEKQLVDDVERTVFDRLRQFFGASNGVNGKLGKQLVELTKDLAHQREQYRGRWRMVTPEDYDFGPSIDPGSSLILVNDYLDFLRGNKLNVVDFNISDNITPLGLKIGGYPWKKFEEAYKKVYGAHPVHGPN